MSRRGAWAGIGFVLVLLVSEVMVTLPASSDSAARIRSFYAAHSAIIIVAQVLSLTASALLLAFVITIWRLTDRVRAILISGILVVLASVVTVVPVLALAVLPHPASSTTHALARAGDYTDAVLFATIALFGATMCRMRLPLWLRLLSAVVAALAIARAVISPLGIAALDVVAPIAFLVLILAIAIELLRRGGLLLNPRGTPAETRAS